MKEEYEAQERERLAALDEDDDDNSYSTDFDGAMWGFTSSKQSKKQPQGKK